MGDADGSVRVFANDEARLGIYLEVGDKGVFGTKVTFCEGEKDEGKVQPLHDDVCLGK